MSVYSLTSIADITGGVLSGNHEQEISQLLTDSRSAASYSSLFFALTGKQHNGHRFIAELYQRGVRAFVISESIDNTAFPEAGFIKVKDTLRALQDLAAYHRRQFSCEILAITGSNGKTIVKEWLYHCLSDQYIITRSPKSYNSQVGVPLSLWLLDKETGLGIIEAGISQPGEMEKLSAMVKPDIGIFTNIGEAHQENFRDIQQKVNEKLKLFGNCHTIVYCSDHKDISGAIQKDNHLRKKNIFTWSLNHQGNVNAILLTKDSYSAQLNITYNRISFGVSLPYSDNASVENALHCITYMLLKGIPPEIIIEKIKDLPPVAMRLEQKSAINNCTLINDSYNSDLNSLSIALDVLNRQVQHKTKTLILSDIFQTGRENSELYRQVSRLMKEKNVTRIIGIGNEISLNASLFSIPGIFYETTDAFIADFNPEVFRDEAILLKGSRSFEFEKIAALLEQKKHTTRIEINLSALAHNLNYFRSLLKPGTKTMVMVKALSYGSGRHEIASVLQFQRVDYLGVAIADEGVSLRNAGINVPIMVMNPEAESFDTMIQNRLEPEIYSFKILELFSKAILRNQENNYPVHIKIDSGMHRLGFLPEEIGQLCEILGKNKNIRIRTIFSHLAGSDEDQFDDFTRDQISVFKDSSDKLIKSIGYPIIRHILNSSGIERFNDAQFEMVRLGIGLYGISSVGQKNLRNVSTLKSTILQIKPVNPGETVGYGRRGIPSRPSKIAIIPVGYADGINRRLSNGNGKFVVNGKAAPIIGNICMDMTMIDVTRIEANEGDEVVIFGEENPLTDMSRKLQTIPYEVLTGVSERVKRVYYYE
ncbi:MAG TPA: bifunctional UDP-N-acetylmuramoyl-tripeptide:D-alanyl-D-alanine ligase/alanine racemase [Bacteroidales bacterium]|jgi:alanine racemase|nr:bifunctional UDP-N-acetylmuramoyl-tripeptide:D-alanyl-D-alanine ligase/alanine racemase [Bacteroidales bacterium]